MGRIGAASSFALAVSFALVSVAAGRASEEKPKKPHLELKASPRFAFSPVNVSLTAELVGGADVEEYHCPELEWDWDDGGKSMHEADCAPFEAGKTTIQRRFTVDHEYRKAGVYQIKATMRRANRTLASATVRVTVRPGVNDPTIERFSSNASDPRPTTYYDSAPALRSAARATRVR
jgi:hypothetical protein